MIIDYTPSPSLVHSQKRSFRICGPNQKLHKPVTNWLSIQKLAKLDLV
jgi:hypothetical protein